MTLNAKIGVLYEFFGDFGLQVTVQERIAPKSIEMNMERLHMKFLALNVDFNIQSLDFLGLKNLHTRASKSGTPVKVVTLLLLASLS